MPGLVVYDEFCPDSMALGYERKRADIVGKENQKGMGNQVPLGRKAEKGHMKKILEENKENLKGMENQQDVDAIPDPSFIMAASYEEGACFEKTLSDEVWEMMRDVSHDLGQCWIRNSTDIGPWMSGALSKFGHLGSRVQAALLRGPPGLPPAPPPVTLWMGGEVQQGGAACPRPWDAAAEELKEITRESLLLGPCHEQMEQLRPDAQDIHSSISAQERQSCLLWFSEVCMQRKYDASVFQECVMLTDRYLATAEKPVLSDTLCIAIASIARKVVGGQTTGPPLRNQMSPEKFRQVLQAELKVLKALDYQTVGHTPLDFLESFLYSLEKYGSLEQGQVTPLKCVATFLLELALGDAHLLHRYPWAILAAGCVYLALWCTQAPLARHQTLMQDVVAALTPADTLEEVDG